LADLPLEPVTDARTPWQVVAAVALGALALALLMVLLLFVWILGNLFLYGIGPLHACDPTAGCDDFPTETTR
jgi:hypothetical protein